MLDWEDPDHWDVPASPPDGWQVENYPEYIHPDGEPQLRVANAADGEPVRDGQHAARFELRESDPDINNGARAELSTTFEPKDAERWYGFSVYLPSDWTIDRSAEIVTQWHQHWDIGSSPPLALGTREGHWEISQVWEGFDQQFPVGAYETGRWTDWVFHVRWSASGDGLVQVWKDGQPVPGFEEKAGKNTYDSAVGNYLKIGLYKWYWTGDEQSDTSRRVMYHDELRIADETGSYQQVAPGGTSPPPPGCSTGSAGSPWQPTGFPPQAGALEAHVDLTPANAPLDAEVALAEGDTGTGNFAGLAVTVRFNPTAWSTRAPGTAGSPVTCATGPVRRTRSGSPSTSPGTATRPGSPRQGSPSAPSASTSPSAPSSSTWRPSTRS